MHEKPDISWIYSGFLRSFSVTLICHEDLEGLSAPNRLIDVAIDPAISLRDPTPKAGAGHLFLEPSHPIAVRLAACCIAKPRFGTALASDLLTLTP